jgi:site-specific DNA-adenine methylase
VRAFWEALVNHAAALQDQLRNRAEIFNKEPVRAFDDMRTLLNKPGENVSAARMGALLLTLNKTCMNGLVRFNSKGEFNVPIGRRQDGSYYRFQPDYEHLDRVRAALVGCGFRIYPGWRDALGAKGEGWGIYCDPPYTGGFVDYTAEGWHSDDDIELYQELAISGALGARVILSQPDTEWARDCCASLLKGWQVDRLEVGRPINSDGQGRGPVGELLIWNKPVERVSVFVPDRVTRIFKNLREEPLSGVKADLVLTDDMFDEGPV